jgi:chromate transporter
MRLTIRPEARGRKGRVVAGGGVEESRAAVLLGGARRGSRFGAGAPGGESCRLWPRAGLDGRERADAVEVAMREDVSAEGVQDRSEPRGGGTRPGRSRDAATEVQRPGYRELAWVFLRISLLGFGGPNAHLALMLDEVVERRRWITRELFLELLGITNLLPGPNSSEVAIHIGYTQRGWRGALVTGLSFLAPTFVLVVLLSFLYFRYGTLPAVEELLWGLKPMIVAIILGAGWKLSRAAVTDWRLLALGVGGVLVAVLLDGWEVAAMVVGGVAGWLAYRRQTRPGSTAGSREDRPAAAPPEARGERDEAGRHGAILLSLAVPLASAGELARLFWLTLWTGSVLFGGGYMLVALIEPYVVDVYGWLTADQFLDGIALTQAVPGPIVMLVAFVGYAVAGPVGAAVATAGIYLPSFTAVLLVAPHLERWRRREWVRAALKGVNAVVAGAILGVALTLLPPAVPDAWAGLLLALGLIALFRFDLKAIWLLLAGLLAGAIRILL